MIHLMWEDYAQRLLAHLVGGASDTDSTFSSCEGFVTGQEAEAFCLLAQKHGGKVTVTLTYLAVISHGTRNAECLQTFADSLSSISSLGAALLDGNGGAYGVGPAGVLESDVLDTTHDFTHIDTLGKADLLGFLAGVDTVLSKNRKDLVDTTGIRFKKRHNLVLYLGVLYSWRGSMYLAASAALVQPFLMAMAAPTV